MSVKLSTPPAPVFYPESDGKPMAENTLQFDWITLLAGELREMYDGRDDVFVAGDLFWYPVEGEPTIVQAPDVFVAFGRPPGYRGSYKQWEEDGIAPQVDFEVRSPGNDDAHLADKFAFYQRHGVEEYYLIDPFANVVEGWKRRGQRLIKIRIMNGWESPRLGIRFEMAPDELNVYAPNGRKFVQREERVREIMAETKRREMELRGQLRAERKAKEALAAKLREMGVDPDRLLP